MCIRDSFRPCASIHDMLYRTFRRFFQRSCRLFLETPVFLYRRRARRPRRSLYRRLHDTRPLSPCLLYTSERRFDEPAGVIEERITVTRSCWGYVSLEVTADCDFIEIPVRNIGDQDFTDDICEIVYRIHPGRMHQGLNQGRIIITGIEERFVVPVTAMVNPCLLYTSRCV